MMCNSAVNDRVGSFMPQTIIYENMDVLQSRLKLVSHDRQALTAKPVLV